MNVWEFQSFMAGLAAGGAFTSILRLVTKAVFEKAHDGLRKGVSTCCFRVIWFMYVACVYMIWN